MNQPFPHRDEIISYQKLRTFIGIIGLLLPVAVVLGCYLLGAGKYSWQISISHYYYSPMHITFVCILCVLGGFLITYKGKDPGESRLSNFAGCCAFGVAAFPTQFGHYRLNESGSNQYLQLCKDVTDAWGNLHFAFAGMLFGCFIVFCLYFFQRPDAHYTGTDKKKFERRKIVYKICGWSILASIVLIVLFNSRILPKQGLFRYSTFIFETTSLWAFGTAWLIKGSVVLKKMPVVKKLIEPLR